MDSDPGFMRRVEEASLNAWPALYQILHDGWLLRFSRGFTKRSNSVIPLYPGQTTAPDALLEKIRFCENLYAREGLPTTFRVPEIAADRAALTDTLTARGYRRVEETHVLTCPTQALAALPAPRPFELCALDDWLTHYAHMIDAPAPASDMHRVILRSIFGECGFGTVREAGTSAACGLGVVEDELMGLFDLVTEPAHRRQGLATELIAHLARWAVDRGARTAYLQVVATNNAALTLYERLGFDRAYRYHYYQAH